MHKLAIPQNVAARVKQRTGKLHPFDHLDAKRTALVVIDLQNYFMRGNEVANARAICPELTVFDADEVADRKTLDDIADWCDRFTPLVALDPPHGLYLDISGCAHLFGGERALLQSVSDALTRRGFTVSAAIASIPCRRPHLSPS